MHLILHKVRGEPAFDIATQLEGSGTDSDPGPWWIIPTSGHRAYPYMNWALSSLEGDVGQGYFESVSIEVPNDWPDHYQIDKGSKPKSDFNIMSIVSSLRPKIKRRL